MQPARRASPFGVAVFALLAGCSALGPAANDSLPAVDAGASGSFSTNPSASPQSSTTGGPRASGVPAASGPSSAVPNGSAKPGGTSDPKPAPPEEPDVFPDGTAVTTETPGAVPDGCTSADSVRPLTKLSTLQYRNTVRDLLSALGTPEVFDVVGSKLQSIPEDSRSQTFSGLDDRISLEHLQGYFNVARAVADAITSDDTRLAKVAGQCALSTSVNAACLADFVDVIGPLTARRPLTAAERTELLGFAETAEAPSDQWRAVIVGALISPHFVNQVEINGAWVKDADTTLRLSAYEVATRLSYTFWQSMPDAQLFAAAADGSLLTEAGVKQQLDRVFKDPRTQATLWNFWQEWFGLDNFTGFELGRPGFQSMAEGAGVDSDTYPAMVDELRQLTNHFTFEEPSTLDTLLKTNVSVTQSATLAGLYGVAPWSGSGAFPTFDSQERGGLFQRAALLVSSLEQTNPFHRGAFFARSLLCQNLPLPDPAALPPGSLDIPPTSGVKTTRERFDDKIANNDLCTGCHGLFTELGYSLEAFDSLGRLRTEESIYDEQTGDLIADLPVDAEATVLIGGTAQTVSSPAELNQLMLGSGNIGNCLATQYVRFTARHALESGSSDACITENIGVAANDPKLGLLGAFRKIAEYQSFYRRKVGPQ
jgi:Protein of unknown function (DUF1592)/Protein of unknown function (DUF1588)/Protein of unknown function (DUF1587)